MSSKVTFGDWAVCVSEKGGTAKGVIGITNHPRRGERRGKVEKDRQNTHANSLWYDLPLAGWISRPVIREMRRASSIFSSTT